MIEQAIPADIDAVTPEWLTRILRQDGTLADACVRAVRHEWMGRPGASGRMARLWLDYDRPAAGAPRTLIAKFSLSDPGLRSTFGVLYQREVGFYADFAPLTRLRTPRCYHGAVDPASGVSILLLEDLASARPGDLLAGCSAEEAIAVARELATFHATWWEDPRLTTFPWLAPFNHLAPGSSWATVQDTYVARWDTFAEKWRAVVSDRFLRFGPHLGRHIATFRNYLSRRPWTICHGDSHLNNLLFETTAETSSVIVVDWQLTALGRGVLDLAYFLSSSMVPDHRRDVEQQAIETYHATLLAHGVRDYSLAECRDDYRVGLMRPVFVVINVGAALDFSSERGTATMHALIRRMTEAIEDHRLDEVLESWDQNPVD
jgi:hypothetical protein